LERNLKSVEECEQKPYIDEITLGDWGITESIARQVCIKQEKDDCPEIFAG